MQTERHYLVFTQSNSVKRTYVLSDKRHRIGNTDRCDVKLDIPGLTPGLWMELALSQDSYSLVRLSEGHTVLLNTDPFSPGMTLSPGDELLIDGIWVAYQIEKAPHPHKPNDSEIEDEPYEEYEQETAGAWDADIIEEAFEPAPVSTGKVRETTPIKIEAERQIVPAMPHSIASPQGNPRLGCAFCLYTLDPNDPDPEQRSFVADQDNPNKRYHRTCWEKQVKAALPDQRVLPLTIQPPTRIKVTGVEPILLHSGPLTTINDRPLGISDGTLVLSPSSDRPFEVLVVKNNANTSIQLDRDIGPAWAYFDWGHYRSTSTQVAIPPGGEVKVLVYAHPMRPIWASEMVNLTQQDRLLLMSRSGGGFQVGAVALGVAVIYHLWSFLVNAAGGLAASVNTYGFGAAVGVVFQYAFTLGVITVLTTFLIPNRLFWWAYRTLERLQGIFPFRSIGFLSNGISNLKDTLYDVFAKQQMAGWLSNPVKLVGGALTTGLLVSLTAIPFGFLVVPILLLLGGFVGLLLAGAYAVLMIWGISTVYQQYGFNLWAKLRSMGTEIGQNVGNST
jgi:hypothetical protein